MHKRLVVLAGCFLMVCHFGCASKPQVKAVDDDYQILQQQLKVAKAVNNQCRKKQDELQKKQNVLQKKQKMLQKKLNTLRSENRSLTQKNKVLEQKVKDKEAILSIQETVIRLFDDSKQTLQNSIKEQIKAKNLER